MPNEADGIVQADVERLRGSLGPFPEAMARPPFVVVSGLPGTGKSHFCRQLSQRMPSVILESDALRRLLFPVPEHSPTESARLFQAIHVLIEELLRNGIPLILDATNLSEHRREGLYHIAEKTGAKLVLVRVEAPVEVVRRRLEGRMKGKDPHDRSDADWSVYRKMQPAAQRIRRRHLAVDTSRDIAPAIDKVMKEISRG
jgi:hypothetical protein